MTLTPGDPPVTPTGQRSRKTLASTVEATAYQKQYVADLRRRVIDDGEPFAIVQADTQSTPYGPGTGGSRTAVIAGGAARAATLAVRDKVLQIAAHVMEASPDDLEISDGTVSVRGTPTMSKTLREIAKIAYVNSDTLPPDLTSGLEATVRYRPDRFPTWSNATHACVVEIDGRETRRINVDLGKSVYLGRIELAA